MPATSAYRARAYPPLWRAVGAALLVASGGSMLLILLLVVLATDPPVTPPMLVRLVVTLTALPALGARLVRWAFEAGVDVQDGTLTIARRGRRVALPVASIAGVVPWALPLPEPGLTLRLASGRALRERLAVPDPTSLLALLAAAGMAGADAAVAHPACAYADARASRPPRLWYHWVGRFVVFALGPTAVLFNVHQHIAYGGLLGEYYLMGAASWLETLGVHWLTVTLYLVLWAALWRMAAETVCLGAAYAAPGRAAVVRRAAEATVQVLYYGGVPVLLALRFLS